MPTELRRHRLSLVLLAFLAALTGSTVVAAATVARRTATADRRLGAETQADDLRTVIAGGNLRATRAIGEKVFDEPEVTRGRLGIGGVARVDGPGVIYLGIMSGPERWGDDVLSPVVSHGRLPDPDYPHEIVINEAEIADGPIDVHIGDHARLHFLTADEFAHFNADEPLAGNGGDLDVEVAGTVRFPATANDLPPAIGSPALARTGLRGVGLLGTNLVQLRPGTDVDAFTHRDARRHG